MDNRKFPSSAHAGGPTRIQGFEAFGQVFPMWGTTPFYRPFEFSIAVPTATLEECARLTCDADTLIEGLGVFFADPNKMFESPLVLEVNGAQTALPGLFIPLFAVGNGFQNLFSMNLFLKKNSVLRVLADAWFAGQGEVSRGGIVIMKGWTFA